MEKFGADHSKGLKGLNYVVSQLTRMCTESMIGKETMFSYNSKAFFWKTVLLPLEQTMRKARKDQCSLTSTYICSKRLIYGIQERKKCDKGNKIILRS